MFISLSKTIGHVGGFRLGVGKRITSKNAWWMFLGIAVIYTVKLGWYLFVVMLWCIYAMLYGMWWLTKAIVKGIISLASGGASAASKVIETKRYNITSDNMPSIASSGRIDQGATSYGAYTNQLSYEFDSKYAGNLNTNRFCTMCGKPITPGNKFCIGCGKPV